MKQLADFKRDWDAKEYLQEFYSNNKVCSSERVSLKYLVDLLKKSDKIFDRAIDVGSGPTLHQIIPLIPYVKELHLSDFLPQNLEEIKKWLNDDPDSHNWDIYIKYVLELEGNGETVKKRKKDMKRVITKLLPIDIYRVYPLGMQTTYPVVTSFYCADSITKNKKEWKQCVNNIFTLVEPGGIIILEGLRNSDAYQIANKHFPSAHVDENDFKSLFEECEQFVNTSIDIQIMDNPEWVDAGFDTMIKAKAEKLREKV